MSNWTLFSNHGHVLVCLARDTEARLRDVAADVGITERAVQKIVRDLQEGGMISVSKHGRRNRYRIHRRITLRHDLEAHCTLGDLMRFVLTKAEAGTAAQQQEPQAEKPNREHASPAEAQTAAKIPSAGDKTEQRQAKPRLSGASQDNSKIEKSVPKQSETKQGPVSEPDDKHPIERQQRSLF